MSEKLQQEHLDAINECIIIDFVEEEQNVNNASKTCASITIEHMKGFAEKAVSNWRPVWYNDYKNFGWYWKGNEEYAKQQGVKTTEELIQLYFESL